MNHETMVITKTGHQNMTKELEVLKTVERPRLATAIAEARALGDLKENAEYHAAKNAQGLLEARIATIENRLARASVVDISKIKDFSRVIFGATVDICDLETGEQISCTIVGDGETDTENQKISIHSPIARALIGNEVGSEVSLEVPAGSKTYEILSIRSSLEETPHGKEGDLF